VGISLRTVRGFLLGFLVLSGAAALGADRPGPFVTTDAPLIEVIVGASIWVNLYWGVVNLLPILPLDGGNVVRSLLPGDADRRDRLATVVSLAFAVVIVVALLRADLGVDLLAHPRCIEPCSAIAMRARGVSTRP
jgi:Zn-dependent protease